MECTGVARKISADGGNLRLQALLGDGRNLLVLPPRFGHVTIGDDAPIWSRDKSGAENIHLHFRPGAVERQDRVPLTVLQRVAILIQPAVTQPFSGGLIAE